MASAGSLPLDAIQDGVLVLDRDGTILDVNDAFCAMLGFARAELAGRRPPFPHWPPGESDALEAAHRAIIAGHLREVELRFCRKDGAPVDVLVAGGALPAGGYAATVKDITERRRAEEVQRVLRRVATAVAADSDPETVFELVAREAARVMEADSAGIVRFESAGEGRLVGCVGVDVALPWTHPLEGSTPSAQVWRTGAPARVDDFAAIDEPVTQRLAATGQRTGVAVPVRTGDALWGALTVGSAMPGAFAHPGAEDVLAHLAELVGLALATADARARLEVRAATDPLTGLLNHRAFQERAQEEVERSRRHGRPLAVAMLDVDEFKPINDTRGHEQGDALLRRVAAALHDAGRASDVPARLGGDEFALLMPETPADGARRLAERIRVAAAEASAADGVRVTLSCGVAELGAGGTAAELLRAADDALYRAKARGRDRTIVARAGADRERWVAERARVVERERALGGLRALARAVDARTGDPGHAERVAERAAALAAALGWSARRVQRMRESAQLHDVGRLAEDPDDGAADASHARTGAAMVAGILDAEQAEWIRAHHERLDTGAMLSEGARVLAVAEACDELGRDACRELAGSALDPDVVEVLGRAHAGA